MSNRQQLSAILCLSGLLVLGGGQASVMAKPIETSATIAAEAIAQANETTSGYTVIHVNAQSGNDQQGDGSQLRPYQTITQALASAEANTLILLSGGVYSADSGEIFPIALQPRVTIQALAGPNTAAVAIQGNGQYYSASSGLRNVAILGADNAGLANVTVSNPHPEGTGLWVESGNPIILDNAFFQNGAHGIYLAGPGAPVIRGNYFAENGQAGLVIAGPSSAQVQANVFENTGAGIVVAPEASPQISDNRISQNLEGLVIHADARPTLSNNDITRNRRNSILDYALWENIPVISTPAASQPSPPTITSAEVSTPADSTELSPAVTPTSVEEIAPSATGSPSIDPMPNLTESLQVSGSSDLAPTPETANLTTPPSEVTATESSIQESIPAIPTDLSPEAALPSLDAIAPPVTGPPALAPPPDRDSLAATTPELTTTEITVPNVPDTVPISAESVLGSNLTSDLDAATLALASADIDFPIASPVSSALGNLNLAPISTAIAAAEQLALSTDDSSATSIAPSAAEPSSAEVFAPLPTVEPAAADGSQSSNTLDQSEAILLPIIPAPEATIGKPLEPQPVVSATNEIEDVIQPHGNLPELPANTAASTTTVTTPLRVPGANIPLGSGGELPDLFTTGAVAGIPNEGPPPPPSLASSLGLNFKVLVAGSDRTIQDAVRARVPDAFRTQVNGRQYMQVGAYPTFEEAQALVDQLSQVGLQAQVEEIP
ncbi:MAG: DUF1565 domain-containing protein [Cyanobacteria bacterium J06626_4]